MVLLSIAYTILACGFLVVIVCGVWFIGKDENSDSASNEGGNKISHQVFTAPVSVDIDLPVYSETFK